MKLTRLKSLGLLLGLFLFFAGEAIAQVTNTTQSTSHTTIQDAIDNATAGDVITVSAGTYSEVLLIDKPISLLGPNASISAVNGTRVAEARLLQRVNISATDDVTVSGFEFFEVPVTNTWTIYIFGDSNNFTFENNRFINIERDAIRSGITSNTGNVTVRGNLIEGITDNLATGILLGGIYGTSVIADNKIDGAVAGVPTAYAGIQTPSATGLTISGNEILNTTNQGLQLAGTVGDVRIENNTISNTNTSEGADKGAIRVYGTDFNGQVIITGNTLTNSYNGVAIKDGEDISGQDILVEFNDLSGNSNFSVYNGATAGTLIATCNWHGSADATEVANSVEGEVTAEPFLVTNDLVTPICGVQDTAPLPVMNGTKKAALMLVMLGLVVLLGYRRMA